MQRRSKKRKADVVEVVDDLSNDVSIFSDIDLTEVEYFPAINDVEQVIKSSREELLHMQLWNVFCGHVGDSIVKSGEGMSSSDSIYALCCDCFFDLINHFDTNEMYAPILSYFPDSKLPSSFSVFVMNVKYEADMSTNFKNEVKHLKDVEFSFLKKLNFGYSVWSDFSRSRRTIMSEFNVCWTKSNLRRDVRDGLPDNVSGLLKTIRMRSYLKICSEKLLKKISNKKVYANREGKVAPFADGDEERQFLNVELKKKKDAGMPMFFFPSEWLCFLLFGRPSFVSRLSSFCDISTLSSGIFANVERVGSSGGLETMNMLKNVDSNPTTVSSITTSSNTLKVERNIEESKIEMLKGSISALQALKNICRCEDYDALLIKELKELHEICINRKQMLELQELASNFVTEFT